MRPYKDSQSEDYIYREFTQDIPEEELVWHRDKRDREVTVMEETDWQFQFDNKLPQTLKDTIFIPKNTYHRVIKGTKDLIVKIKEI